MWKSLDAILCAYWCDERPDTKCCSCGTKMMKEMINYVETTMDVDVWMALHNKERYTSTKG